MHEELVCTKVYQQGLLPDRALELIVAVDKTSGEKRAFLFDKIALGASEPMGEYEILPGQPKIITVFLFKTPWAAVYKGKNFVLLAEVNGRVNPEIQGPGAAHMILPTGEQLDLQLNCRAATEIHAAAVPR